MCSPGFGGAVVTGYFSSFPPPFGYQVFERLAEALAWLGRPAEAQDIHQLRQDAGSEADSTVARLRAWLDVRELDRVDLEGAARHFGVTARTLQRHLAAVGSSFTGEVASVRVARAQRMMMDPEVKLITVATEVGCASASTFSELFHRVTGETPSAWRRRKSTR